MNLGDIAPEGGSGTDLNAAEGSVPPATPSSTIGAQSPSTQKPKPLTERWLDLTAFSHSQRFRSQFGDDGFHYFEDGQQRSLIAGKFKFDRDSKVTLGFRASSGKTFNWSYADYAGTGFAARIATPAEIANLADPTTDPAVAQAYATDPAGVAELEGLDSAGWDFYPRELYLSVAPVKQIAFEFGSFGIERGYSTEITTFDDDGYIAGERIRISDPHHFFFDQVTLTSAFLGDFQISNLLGRGDSFSKSNYRQVAVRKQLNPRIGISGEYNWISKNARTHTIREAAYVDVRESKIFNKVRLEVYEKLNFVQLEGNDQQPRQGAAITAEKKVGKVAGDFGFASINRDYGIYGGSNFLEQVGFSLNGDNYNTGIRYYSHLSYKLTPSVTAFGFYTHKVGQVFPNLNNQGLNAGLTLDLKALANKDRLIF